MSEKRIPIELLKRQINDDYYRGNKSFRTIAKQYEYYSEDDLKKVLGIYDLAGEQKGRFDLPESLKAEWNETCRKINPKAWR